MYEAVGLWLSARLQLLSAFILGGAAVLCVALEGSGGDGPKRAAVAGLALTFAPMLTDNLNNLLRNFTMLETNMVSAERLFQYVDLEPEGKLPAAQGPAQTLSRFDERRD